MSKKSERLLKDTKFYRKVDTIISYITQYVDCPNQEPAHFKIFPKVQQESNGWQANSGLY